MEKRVAGLEGFCLMGRVHVSGLCLDFLLCSLLVVGCSLFVVIGSLFLVLCASYILPSFPYTSRKASVSAGGRPFVRRFGDGSCAV